MATPYSRAVSREEKPFIHLRSNGPWKTKVETCKKKSRTGKKRSRTKREIKDQLKEGQTVGWIWEGKKEREKTEPPQKSEADGAQRGILRGRFWGQ